MHPNFYTTGRYVSTETSSISFGLPPDAKMHGPPDCNLEEYKSPDKAAESIWRTIMDTNRKPIQVYGHVVDEEASHDDQLDKVDFDSFKSIEGDTVKLFLFRRFEDRLLICEGRITIEYKCALIAMSDIATNGDKERRGWMGELLTHISEREELDIAGLYDLIPLLAIIDEGLCTRIR
jgi:hypothetical protein